MNTVEKLLKLDINDLIPKKMTEKIEIKRISNKLKKKGINDGFFITFETINPDKIYEYDSAIYDYNSKGVTIDKKEIYKQGLDVCCIAIKDPQYNDQQLLDFLGIAMKQPTPEEVWKKLFLKQEIVNIGQIIVEFSRKVLNEDEYNENLDKLRDKLKN